MPTDPRDCLSSTRVPCVQGLQLFTEPGQLKLRARLGRPVLCRDAGNGSVEEMADKMASKVS